MADFTNVTVGVLALQGAVAEHRRMIEKLGARTVPIKKPADFKDLDALILPGGESTTISKLIREYGLTSPIKALAAAGAPVLGTCAGLIVAAKEVRGGLEEEPLGLINITVSRNAFGRQVDSFETDLTLPALGKKSFPAVFIRAPLITSVGPGVRILACLAEHGADCGKIVAAKEKNVIVCAFHPELTTDDRLHRLFLEEVAGGHSIKQNVEEDMN